ncbi:MAG: hypothetical protein IT342_21635 [Candidatus Melainabacteria bacterium]|nr:hypothetical protein [Candidatus Melainabacteria bacterium]
MESLGTFGTLYVVSAALGFGYMIFSMVSGQIGHDAGGDSGDHGALDGHDTGAHALLGHDHAGHETGAHGHAGGGHEHAGHGHGGHDHGSGDEVANQLKEVSKVANMDHGHTQTPVLLRVMSWISPASMAIFLGFFGITGMAIFKLGFISLLPAIAVGLLMRNVTMMMLRWFVRQSHVSTTSRVEEAIGHAAEVCVSIQPGRTGEVTYVLGSKRYNMPAKSSVAESEYKRGAKVMITDVREGVVFVDPWQELTI